MAETVDVPAVGRVDKRYVYAGMALVAGIVGYAWWVRSRQASAATADPLAIEPEQPQTGGAYSNPRPVTSTVDGTDPGAITTNTQWSARVTEKLGQLGYDSAFLSATIGAYLARQQLTADQGELIRTAWAYAGKPPEGPDTFTLKGTSTGGGGTTPDPTGKLPAPAGFRQGDNAQWTFAARLDWNEVPGAAGYRIEEVTGTAAGWTAPLDVGQVNATMKYDLVHNGSYHVRIAAKDAGGQLGAWSPTIVVHTHN